MANLKLYKTTCLAIALATSITLSGCNANNSRVNNEESVDHELTIDDIKISESNGKITFEVEDGQFNINASENVIDNIEIEIKPNEANDGSLVFIKNIYEYILEDGYVEYGIIFDVPKDKTARSTKNYSYTYKVTEGEMTVFTVYEIDGNGNENLLETYFINKDDSISLSK